MTSNNSNIPQVDKRKYFNYKMCAACGGACCKRLAGSYVPNDFKEEITIEFLLSLLQSGKFAIDWWEGDATGGELDVTYYLRPRHKNEAAIKGSWGGECVNFTVAVGCSLSEEERPYQCRVLIPNYNNGIDKCDTLPEDKADKQDCAAAWYPFQLIFEEVIRKYDE